MKLLTIIITTIVGFTLQSCKLPTRPITDDPCVRTALQVIEGVRDQKPYENMLRKANVDCYPPEAHPEVFKTFSDRFAESGAYMTIHGVLPVSYWQVWHDRMRLHPYTPDTSTTDFETVVIPLNFEPVTIPADHYVIMQFRPGYSTSEYINYQMLDSNELKERLSLMYQL